MRTSTLLAFVLSAVALPAFASPILIPRKFSEETYLKYLREHGGTPPLASNFIRHGPVTHPHEVVHHARVVPGGSQPPSKSDRNVAWAFYRQSLYHDGGDNYGRPTGQGGAHPAEGSHPQSSGQHPQSSGQHPQSSSQHPQSSGQHPQASGQHPQSSSGQQHQSSGQQPHSGQSSGQNQHSGNSNAAHGASPRELIDVIVRADAEINHAAHQYGHDTEHHSAHGQLHSRPHHAHYPGEQGFGDTQQGRHGAHQPAGESFIPVTKIPISNRVPAQVEHFGH